VKEKKNLVYSALILVILVILTYGGAGKHQFVGWDDSEYVTGNPLVKSKSGIDFQNIFSTVISLNYHPLTILSLRLNNNDCKDCPEGISAKPFILGNIYLHLLNSLLVFLMLWLLGGKKILAPLLTAALFAVHPMHVESVAWVSERKDVLYTFFFLSGIITYLKFIEKEKGGYGWLAATFVLFVLSCLSKAVAVVFPVVLMLVNFWSYKRAEPIHWKEAAKHTLSGKNLLLMAPFFAVSLLFGLIASYIQAGYNFDGIFTFLSDHRDAVDIIGPLSVFQHLQVGAYGFFAYLILFIFPANLSPYHPYPMLSEFSQGAFSAELWISVLAFVVLLIFTFRSLKKTRLLFFCLGFYFVTIVLVLQFVSVGTSIIAERYSYIPYIGLAFLPATLIAGAPEKAKKILLLLSGTFIFILVLVARHQVKTWSDTETLWTQVIKQHPRLELPRKGRGKYYYLLSSRAKNSTERTRYEDLALADFDIAMQVRTKDADVYDATGVILNNRGESGKALTCIEKALSIEPSDGGMHYNRAMVLDALGRKEESIKEYTTALGLNPELSVKILSNRAVLLTETGRFAAAERDLDVLLISAPSNYMYYYNRAYVRVRQNNFQGAISDYQTVLRIKPDNQEAMRELQLLKDNGIK
jgi:protein O-mannosyl-transferase